MDYQVANRTSFLTLTLLTVIGLSTGRATAQQGPQFGLPLNCSGDAPCFVQNLVDIDRGKGILDPFCNAATFDKHKGTDIRLPNIAARQRWGDILSIADGVVTATRGNMADRLWQTKADQKRFKGRECGNGVAINHGKINGVEYTSQFCHMARRSITVRAGDQVKRGDKIGAMGLSGADQALRSIDFCFLFDCQNGALGGLVQPCPFVADPTQPDENGIGNANTFVDCPIAL